jgi:hypothetical protein
VLIDFVLGLLLGFPTTAKEMGGLLQAIGAE